MAARTFLYHLLAWAVFIAYEVSVVFLASGPLQMKWWEYTGYYALNILLFYTNACLALRLALQSRRWYLLLPVLIPLELALYVLLEYGLEHLYNLVRETAKPVLLDQRFVWGYTWRGLYFIGLSTTYHFVARYIQHNQHIGQLQQEQLLEQKRRAELEKNLFRSQNAFLQAQINPHLLFNTLNFIYNSIQETETDAAESVLLLSELMHYALAPVDPDGKTELAREVGHIEKYVALNQLRFRTALHLRLEVPNICKETRIPPLLLLPFVENVFTHGDLTDAEHPGRIRITCEGARLSFRTQNKKRRRYPKSGHGIGMQNVATRLQDFYPAAHRLAIQEEEKNFIVELEIDLA